MIQNITWQLNTWFVCNKLQIQFFPYVQTVFIYIGTQSRTKDKFRNMNENQSRYHFFQTCKYADYYYKYWKLWDIYNWTRYNSGASFNQEHNNPFSPRANSKEMSPPTPRGKNVRDIVIFDNLVISNAYKNIIQHHLLMDALFWTFFW